MEVHDQPRVRAWRIALVLLLVYAIYVPHLFLTVAVTPAGHSLAGPWKGWEILLGIGIFFWLTVPLFGDLSFWVASVLFARHQFRFALIVGAIGLGLCATLYSFPMTASYLGGESPQGALWAPVLRLTSMGLLVGFAWRFSKKKSSDAPFWADHRDPGFQPREAEQAWRDNKLLKARKGAILPDRCFKCNAPADGYQFSRRLTWASPLWAYTINSVSPLLCGLIPFVIIYNIVCWRGKITAGLCPRHRKRRGRAILGAWLTGLAGFLLFFVTAVGRFERGSDAETGNLEMILLLAGCLAIFGAIIAGFFATRVLVAARMDEHFIWLKRVAPEYLATFSDWGV